MVAARLIDTAVDVRTDAGGRDPDRYSTTFRRYHRLLWGKPLPGGAMFDLDARLHHMSELGEFWLSSDSIGHTYPVIMVSVSHHGSRRRPGPAS